MPVRIFPVRTFHCASASGQLDLLLLVITSMNTDDSSQSGSRRKRD